MNRVLDIVRLHLLDRRLILGTLLAVPLFVALGVGVTAAEIAATGSLGRGFATGLIGGLYGGIAALQATATVRLLQFAVAMGRTRREFHVGTLLFVLIGSLVVGALLHLLLGVEQLTGGWGADLSFLATARGTPDDPVLQYLAFTAPLLLLSPVIPLGAAVFLRWGLVGLIVAALVGGAVVGLVVALGGTEPLTSGVGAPMSVILVAALVLLLGAAGWSVVRRTPV